ncbi:MAG TPA: alpha/beta hydrolase [Streptosporangiaceae bacterium]|jgi:acetyl esterase/lipase|nr:alpha/beta hydrolase [Streptosporangiaceae bacterium]HEX2820781.1 alpha/beta hydrolase [Streptosporangiaceae bacterium]
MLTLDPQIAEIISSEPSGRITAETLNAMRAANDKPSAPPSPGIERRDYTIGTEPAVSVRVHRPADAEGALPCVYSMHGGGYVLGSYATDDARLDGWSESHRCVGVSVEYRLAPETPYPGPLDDCYLGLKWVFDHHNELGVDPERVGVSGTSAGAGLAAALALLARDRGELPLQFQLLDAPMIDDRQLTPSSQLDDLVIFDRQSSEFGWRSYLGDLYGKVKIPVYAAPTRATDLRGLPAAYICVGNVDGFRDEAIDYATRLNEAGVPAELHVYAGAPHGVKRFADVPVARRYTEGINEWIGSQLQARPRPVQEEAGPDAQRIGAT